jgi:hypothetical protein
VFAANFTWVMYCANAGCCDNWNVDRTVDRMVNAIKSLILRCTPGVPIKNKWTKIGPALDYALAGTLVHNCLRKVMRRAFGATSVVI